MYTVKEDQQHGLVLVKDGKEAICPFQAAIPTQTQMGGLAIMRMPCSTCCPHADYFKYNDTTGVVESYVITCSGHQVTIDLDPKPLESPLKLI